MIFSGGLFPAHFCQILRFHGRPFFAMEYFVGAGLSYLAETSLIWLQCKMPMARTLIKTWSISSIYDLYDIQ
jgi:hypothetical protein